MENRITGSISTIEAKMGMGSESAHQVALKTEIKKVILHTLPP